MLYANITVCIYLVLYAWHIIRYFGQLKSLPDSWNLGAVSCRTVVLISHIIQNHYTYIHTYVYTHIHMYIHKHMASRGVLGMPPQEIFVF